jgi:hypothetical protein
LNVLGHVTADTPVDSQATARALCDFRCHAVDDPQQQQQEEQDKAERYDGVGWWQNSPYLPV